MVCAAFSGHSDRSRAIANLLAASFDANGLKRAEAAEHMKLANDKQLIRQLAGQEPMNLHRVAELPDATLIAWIERVADWLGCKLLTPDEVDLLRGAAALTRKRMARMTVPADAERKRA